MEKRHRSKITSKKNLIITLYISLFLLIVSGCLNFIFFSKLKTAFVKLQYIRLFPIGFSYQSNELGGEITKENNKPVSLVFVGDSRVQMWDTTSLEYKYAVSNIGHGGQTTAQILFQVNSYKIPRGDWMIFQAGINDIHSIGSFRKKSTLIVSNCKENIKTIIQRFRAQGYQIILTTLFPFSKIPFIRTFFWDKNSLKIIHEVNLFLKELSLANDIHLVDAFELLKNENNMLLQTFKASDFFLHVNPKAYTFLNNKVEKIINNYYYFYSNKDSK